MNNKNLIFYLSFYLTTVLLTVSNASAEIHQVESLEWKISQSPLIVVGKVEKVTILNSGNEEAGAHFQNEEVEVQVLRVLRGPQAGKEMTFFWRPLGIDTAQDWQKNGHEVLFFFTPNKIKSSEYTLQDSGSFVDLVTLKMGWYPAVSMDQTVFKTKEDLLSRVENELSLIKKGERSGKSLILDVSEDTDAMDALWGGSAVFLKIPYEYAKDFSKSSVGSFETVIAPERTLSALQAKELARAHLSVSNRNEVVELYLASDREKHEVQEKDNCQFKKGTNITSANYRLVALSGDRLLSQSRTAFFRFQENPELKLLGKNKLEEPLLTMSSPPCDGVTEIALFSLDSNNKPIFHGYTWANEGQWTFDGEKFKACVLNKEKQKKLCRVQRLGSKFVDEKVQEIWE